MTQPVHEIVVRIQSEEADAKKFGAALKAFGEYLLQSDSVPKELSYRQDGVIGRLELQATMSHINSIERQLRNDLAKVEARLNDPNTPEADKEGLQRLRESLQAAIEGIEEGEDETKAW